MISYLGIWKKGKNFFIVIIKNCITVVVVAVAEEMSTLGSEKKQSIPKLGNLPITSSTPCEIKQVVALNVFNMFTLGQNSKVLYNK